MKTVLPAAPETGAVPLPQQRVKRGVFGKRLKLGGTTKCVFALSSQIPWDKSAFFDPNSCKGKEMIT
jgi:hypothetical protein